MDHKGFLPLGSLRMNRRRWLTAISVAVVVALAAVFVWSQMLVHQERDIAVPPNDAAPAEVVQAYLDSLDAHDCSTAVALTIPKSNIDERKRCRGTDSVTNIEVASASVPEPNAAGAHVDVSFDMQPRWWSQDQSMVGPTTWTYHLQRAEPGQPWRIGGGGEG